MAYRLHRVAGAVREVVSDAIANRLWDPRIHRLTTVTRVEVSADLQVAKVYLSILGSAGEARRSMEGMQSARGAVQKMLARRLEMRQCPELRFYLDEGPRRAQETFRKLDELRGEATEDASAPPGVPEADGLSPHEDPRKEAHRSTDRPESGGRAAGIVEAPDERPSDGTRLWPNAPHGTE